MTPAQFDGTVTTWGSLPAGVNTWPPGATLTTTLYYGQDIGHAAHQYGEPWERFSVRPGEIEGMPRDGVLVRLGDTGTVFSPDPTTLSLAGAEACQTYPVT
ncbi:hypothetical protein [Brevundimonas denitrificans]|uniref:hypothetical protein n=1 Tax=Brevundimonas denitrificans TaxID=1443434 RepID=UPI00223B6297|nr:hypothetical protein [Brevundimonas denitrificans]